MNMLRLRGSALHERPQPMLPLLLLTLLLAGCSGSSEATQDGAADGATGAAEEAAEDTSGGGELNPAVFDSTLCDQLDGESIEGIGALTLQSASSNSDTNLVCFYTGDGSTGVTALNITINQGGTADRTLLANFDGEGVEPYDGFGDVAILQPTNGVRAFFEPGLLVTVTASIDETTDSGLRLADLDASITAADVFRPLLLEAMSS